MSSPKHPRCCCCCCLKDVVAMTTVRGQCRRPNIDETIKQAGGCRRPPLRSLARPGSLGRTLAGQITSSTRSFPSRPSLSARSPSTLLLFGATDVTRLPIRLARQSRTKSVDRLLWKAVVDVPCRLVRVALFVQRPALFAQRVAIN